jgi:hypothetical protein
MLAAVQDPPKAYALQCLTQLLLLLPLLRVSYSQEFLLEFLLPLVLISTYFKSHEDHLMKVGLSILG